MNDNEIIEVNESQKISSSSLMLNTETMMQINQLAQTMAQGVSTVPKHLQGNPADCMAICMQAAQWGMNPFAVAQKTHLVNGTLGYEAQLVNAVISSSAAVQGRFKYEYGGDWDNLGADCHVRCGAVLANEEEITWGEPVHFHTQTTKNSPLWKTNPKQQIAYLAVKMWSRMYTPDVILGVYTPEELTEREINPIKRTARPSARPAAGSAFGALNAKKPKKEHIEVETGEIISQHFESAKANLLQCSTLAEINEASSAISTNANLTTDEMNSLRGIYSTHKKTLTE